MESCRGRSSHCARVRPRHSGIRLPGSECSRRYIRTQQPVLPVSLRRHAVWTLAEFDLDSTNDRLVEDFGAATTVGAGWDDELGGKCQVLIRLTDWPALIKFRQSSKLLASPANLSYETRTHFCFPHHCHTSARRIFVGEAPRPADQCRRICPDVQSEHQLRDSTCRRRLEPKPGIE